MPDLTTRLCTIKLRNPTILASGILDEDANTMQRVYHNGAAAVVTKSIGITPRDGYPNPTLIDLDYCLLNAMGLPNPGIDEYLPEIQQTVHNKIPTIASIYGATPHEFTTLATKMQSAGAHALELNLSCPHAKHYGLQIGCDKDLITHIIQAVKQAVHIPVFPKLSPNVTDIVDIATTAADAKADGIVAINTLKAMKIDLDLQRPILANAIGGLSGKALKPIGVRCVYELAEHLDIPIIGVGGILTGEDALEYIMAGATAVQIGSGIYYRQIDIFTKICSEITTWMNNHNYRNLSELIGVAHQ
ncbi:MAG: dihydroorotate dehydrogenase [Candidatus Thermoplasmatota archaeon]|nr:dihydroorotate dehydrogenase [Candidatus Thermoplasmatota archaeon]MBU1940504.1 dihydroorotate dehydrogenase [Candidatus Thermoplasmatota archaeon]